MPRVSESCSDGESGSVNVPEGANVSEDVMANLSDKFGKLSSPSRTTKRSELSNSAAAASSSSANSATDSEMLDFTTSATAALVPSPPSDINQNNFSESSLAAASSMEVVHGESNILAPVSASGSIPWGETVTATTNQVASVGVASLPQKDVPSFEVNYVNDLFCKEFPVGRVFDTKKDVINEVKKFAANNYFNMRTEGRQGMKCSMSANSNSKAKEAGEKTLSTKEFSQSCNCPVAITWSMARKLEGKVQISFVEGLHNHPCDVPQAAVSQRLSGRNIESILPLVAVPFAPHLHGGKKITLSSARKILKAHVGNGIDIDAKSLSNVIAAVSKYINYDKFEGIPPIDSTSILSMFADYVTNDVATEKCSDVLEEIITNSSGETSWMVHQLMARLKEEDPYEFDYRMHYDRNGHIDAVCWQTGVHRAAFQLYGSAIFLDARKKDNMNVLGMRYMTLVVIDANNKFWPISHAFVFEEDHMLYGFACNSTLDMTPGRTKESVLLGYGDMFFEPEQVKLWFPNILMMIDAYHLIYAKNNKSILAREFGPIMWNALKSHFTKALEADTKDEFIKHIDSAILVAGGDQGVKDLIVKWQDMGDRWAHYSRNTVPSHRFISTSSYAEQNHSSIKAIAPDDPNQTLEEHIVRIMERDKTRFDLLQKENYRWASVQAAQIAAMPQCRAIHLAPARKLLVEKSYRYFLEQFEHAAQYRVTDMEQHGLWGANVEHVTASETEGRFIPDGECCKLCADHVAMTMCRHDIAKSMHRKVPAFNPTSIDPIHLFHTIIPRARLDGSFVATVAKRSATSASVAKTAAAGAIVAKTAAAGDNNINNSNENDAVDFSRNDLDEDGGSGNGAEGVVDALSTATTTVQYDVLSSPSKLLVAHIPQNSEGTSTIELRRSVPYATFLNHGQAIAGVASSLPTEIQHAVNTHLTSILDLLNTGDYSNDRHDGTCVGWLANSLAAVAEDRSAVQSGMPRQRMMNKRGRKRKYRLGSEQSTVSSTQLRKCGFCGAQGSGPNTSHKNQSSCPMKAGYGDFSKISDAKSIASIAAKLEQILGGTHVDFRSDMADIIEAEDIGRRKFVESIPSGTKRLQVKGYHKRQGKSYLFCTCIDKQGVVLTRREGLNTETYAELFISHTALVTSLNRFDFVFWRPSSALLV